MKEEKGTKKYGSMTRREALLGLGGAMSAALVAGAFAQEDDRAERLRQARERRAADGNAQEGPAEPVHVDTAPIRDRLPKTAKAIEEAAKAGRSGQLYISLAGAVIADFAWGETRDGNPLTKDSIVAWASAVKPTTCVALMRHWDGGKLDLDDKVTKFIPEFGVNGKEDVRIRHLLTHSAHLGGYRGPMILPGFDIVVNGIIEAPREPYTRLGQTALPKLGTSPGYNPAGIWIIAEICRRIEGRPFAEIVRKEVYEPAGMKNSWCGMPLDRYREYQANKLFASNYLNNDKDVVQSQPEGGGLSPARELALFYEMMLNRGIANGHRIISPQTVEAMITPKTGIGVMGIWGLGFNLAFPENVAPASTEEGNVPRRPDRYGPHVSPRTFGHSGASGMQAYADPEHGLAVAHIGRAVIDGAIYEDLKLV